MERKAPPRPASPPEMMTATYLYLRTLTPRDSAATGFSPQERRRRPNDVRHSAHHVNGIRATAMIVSGDRSVTRPPSRPAMSEIRNQCFSFRVVSQSDRPGTLNVPSVSTGGDCLVVRPSAPPTVKLG